MYTSGFEHIDTCLDVGLKFAHIGLLYLEIELAFSVPEL